MPDKLPPHNLDAEKAILGAMVCAPRAVEIAVDKLFANDFFDDRNKIIFNAMFVLNSNGIPIDTVTLANYLETNGLFTKLGSASYIASYIAALIESVPAFSNVSSYIDIIIDKSMARKIYFFSHEITSNIDNGVPSLRILNLLEDFYFQNAPRLNASVKSVEMKTDLQSMYSKIDDVSTSKRFNGIQSGYANLDKIISGGFEHGDLIILAARPAMGKTAFATNIALKLAKRGVTPLMFSLEMTKEKMMYRFISLESHVAVDKMKTGKLKSHDIERIVASFSALNDLNIIIDDTPGLTIESIRTRAIGYKNKYNVGIVFIDHIQLIDTEEKHHNRVAQLTHISKRLKVLAKELNLPVIALAQLSRAVESRQDKRPVLSDLRESGSIEQDADIVMFLYRANYYARKAGASNNTELIIAKNRDGSSDSSEIFGVNLWCGEFFESQHYNGFDGDCNEY